jgi:hypothetical protein
MNNLHHFLTEMEFGGHRREIKLVDGPTKLPAEFTRWVDPVIS